ncbi:Bifunctional protein Aas [Campylobacter majalis]|uniref:Bifunctional protein Aas n=1 Tax=Campylobacter majalis TaxID=2790656 RepID=A0ABM8Q2E7_9BACT|nr:AMP-binding protein [Campylobacter majalis]CAD7286936.1 Bifunctional protein Aas [Campylobacter majalis]
MLKKYNTLISKAVGGLKSKNVKNAQIYLEDSDEFIVAFFACLALDLKPLVLSQNLAKNDSFFINNINDILGDESEFIIGDDAEFFLLTSGSSGEAKLISKSLHKMILEAKALAKCYKFGDEFIASVTHQHMFGLTFKIFLPLVLGAKIEPKFLNYPEFIYEQNLKNKTLISSPTLLKALLSSDKKQMLSQLKNIITAGAKLDDELKKELCGLVGYINVYGSTETGVVACDEGLGFRLFDGVNAFIANERLGVVSPWCDEFIMGDMARLNERELVILGRADRVVKINEKRISLDMLESLISQSELINECACIQIEQRIGVAIVLSEIGARALRDHGKKGINETIKNLVKDEYQNNLRLIKIVKNIPKNTQGKVLKSEIEKLFNKNEIFEFRQIFKDEVKAEYQADVEPSLFYFDGHFYDFALVPGFIQLECVVKLARNFGLDLTRSKKFEAIKFSGFLRPLDVATFFLEIKNNKLYFSIKNDTKICASGRICIN